MFDREKNRCIAIGRFDCAFGLCAHVCTNESGVGTTVHLSKPKLLLTLPLYDRAGAAGGDENKCAPCERGVFFGWFQVSSFIINQKGRNGL